MSKIVLCVDDSATMQQVADITFRGTEFTYVGARNVDEAIEKAKGGKPAIVLADSMMPGKTGYDLCLALKSDPRTADVPVVILVGNGAPYDSARGAEVGADANLPKPWDTQSMLEKVAEIVTKAASGVAAPGAAAAAQPAAAAPAPTAAAAPAPRSAPAAAPAPAAAAQAPRSATIMGMPTIKMPSGNAPAAPAAAKPAPAPAASAPSSAGAASAGPSASGSGLNLFLATNRAPMVTGSTTKRSALVERALQTMASRLAEQSGLQEGSPELMALLKLSAEVVERVVWEVVPVLAEQIIRENLQDLTSRRSS